MTTTQATVFILLYIAALWWLWIGIGYTFKFATSDEEDIKTWRVQSNQVVIVATILLKGPLNRFGRLR